MTANPTKPTGSGLPKVDNARTTGIYALQHLGPVRDLRLHGMRGRGRGSPANMVEYTIKKCEDQGSDTVVVRADDLGVVKAGQPIERLSKTEFLATAKEVKKVYLARLLEGKSGQPKPSGQQTDVPVGSWHRRTPSFNQNGRPFVSGTGVRI